MAGPPYKNLCQMGLSQDSTDWSQGIPSSLSQIGSQANLFTPILGGIGDPTYQNALYHTMFVGSQGMMKPQYKEPIRIEDEEEGNAIPDEPISKKYKKSKNETKGEGGMKGCGTPNKRWNKEESGFLLEFLAEQAANGNKSQKTFKKPVLIAAIAAAVNQKFSQSFTLLNLENHLRGLKAKWKDICHCRDKISGAGWDEDKKMIILDDLTYKTYVLAHETRRAYLNCHIPFYEEMKIVCGEDFATGSFRKNIYDSFGDHDESSNNDINSGFPITMTDDGDVADGANEKQNVNNGTTPQKNFKKAKHPKEKKSNDSKNDDQVKELKEGLTFIAKAIENATPEDWSLKLNKVIMAIEGHNDDDLDAVFEHYADSEHKALTFIAKPPTRQKKIVDDYIKNMKGFSEI